MSGDETGAGSEPVAKLTIGQRILTALPNLDRQKPSTRQLSGRGGSTRANVASSRQARDASTGEADELDETLPPNGDDDGGGGDGDVEDAKSRPATGTSRQRDRTGREPASGRGAGGSTDLYPGMSNDELRYGIKRIDDRERRYAFIAGIVGAPLGIALTIAAIHYNPPLHHKGHVADSVTWAYGAARVVLSALVVGTAMTKRRSLVAFSLLFLGTAEGFPSALLFWGLGGWMIWRVFRYQKALTARGAGPQRTRATQGPRAAAGAGSSDARERARARSAAARDRRRGRRQPEPTGPSPSKRYTPPKPTRPRPPAPS